MELRKCVDNDGKQVADDFCQGFVTTETSERPVFDVKCEEECSTQELF